MKTTKITQDQILELASELAHNRAADYLFNDEVITHESEMYIENDDMLIYTDVAQDEFNRCYDYYLTIIENILK